MRFLAVFFFALLLSAPANSTIRPEHKTCTNDQDCSLVMVSCTECCSTPSEFDAVNKQYQKEDQNPEVCTADHIRACGVPECGLFTPEPYPVAVCSEGVCAVKVHPPDPRPSPSALEDEKSLPKPTKVGKEFMDQFKANAMRPAKNP